MVVNEQRIPFPRDWWAHQRRIAEGWDNFRVFISPSIPPPPASTNVKLVTQVIPFPKPWEKRHQPEGWDAFRMFVGGAPAPPPPAGAAVPTIVQMVPFPRDGTMDARRPDAWTLFRPFWTQPATTIHTESSLRFWPDDEGKRITEWQYFRPYWVAPGAPPPPPAAPFNAYVTPPPPRFDNADIFRVIDHWALFRPYWTEYVPPPPPPSSTDVRGGGRSKKKRERKRLVVTVDGEDFFVESAEEAAALLVQAREAYKEQLALTKAKKAPIRLPKIRASGPDGPERDALVAEVAALRMDIKALYQEALAALERLDEEEAISLLL